MIEQKIRFHVVRIKYEDRDNDTSRASVRIKGENRNMDIKYPYMELDLEKEYEALVIEELEDKAYRVEQITGIHNVANFVKEVLKSDKKISKELKGNIVKEIGEEPIGSLKDLIEYLIDLEILDNDKAEYISEKAEKYADLLEIRAYCKVNKIEESIANNIYKEFGINALDVIKNDPYLLISYGVSLKAIDRVADKAGLTNNNINRVKCGIVEYIKYCSTKIGHVFIFKDEITENLNEYMNRYGEFPGKDNISNKVIEEAILQLKAVEITKLYINANGEQCIYLKELFECETGIGDVIARKLLKKVKISEPIKEDVESFLSQYKDGHKELTTEQAQAVRNTFTENVSMLHGYPGVGKTQTLRAIVSCINAVYKGESTVQALAFTGKAVSKLSEVLPEGTSSKTIHRFLRLNKGKEFIPEEKEVDFLLIDESTMIDSVLFFYILQSINEYTHIILIGDENQLSSIGSGDAFHNLLKTKLIKTVKLTKIFRQEEGSTITKNIHKMAEGIGFADENGLKCKKGEFELIALKTESEITQKIKKTVERLNNDGHSLNDIQILSPIRQNLGGTIKLNKIMEAEFSPTYRIVFDDFIVGKRVMQNVNNYDLQIFNGEIGMVAEIEDSGSGKRLTVKYNNKLVEYNKDNIKELESAFAITIHKSQGSEFPIVILPVLKSHKDVLNLNMIYTACSRAKRQLIIIAAEDTFDKAIKKKQDVRNSNLIEIIIGGLREREDRIA